MNEFLSALSQIWNFLADTLSAIFTSYATVPILVAVFVLWILDAIFGIFRRLRR